MRRFRPWFKACLFWLPIAVTLLLNPGRNGINIPHFSAAALITLAVCGVALICYAVLGLVQPTCMQAAISPEPVTARDRAMVFLSFLFGFIGIYYAGLGAGLVGG